MDGDWNSTLTIKIVSSIVINDTFEIIWDNHTNGYIPTALNKRHQQYFLIGMAFVGGLIVGIILHFLYVCLTRYILSEEDEDYPTERGVVNFSFIGDDSRPPVDDRPPDYATVVSGGNNEGDASANQKRTRSLIERIFKRSATQPAADCGVDESPPSYSSVVSNLEVDVSVRWQSDDRIDFLLTERLPGQDR